MRILQQFETEPHACAYLPDREAVLDYQYVARMTPQEYEDQMNEGYRKFGPMIFRPVCSHCNECRPIRIPVAEFRPDRSQRRAWKRNADLQIRIAPPSADDERLTLYHRYHEAQSDRKGWPEKERDTREYAFSFVHSPIPGLEISMWEADRLRAVVLTDVTPNVISGVYHYYEPELAERSIGTFCMLHTLELARRLEKRWAYFGFYVAASASMQYKARFRPCEVMSPDGVWEPFRG